MSPLWSNDEQIPPFIPEEQVSTIPAIVNKCNLEKKRKKAKLLQGSNAVLFFEDDN